MKLILATRNPHKVEEIGSMLRIPGLHLISALEYPDLPDVEEDGDTFEANAIKKAVSLARATGCWALADDSGLEVAHLGGAPGVRSARYAGEPVSYAANNRKLLEALQHQSDRRAQFRCVMALACPSGKARTVEGVCRGHIIAEERGAAGFGYDPLFVPEGFTQTFAEMDGVSKNRLSHRGKAIAHARLQWDNVLATLPDDWP